MEQNTSIALLVHLIKNFHEPRQMIIDLNKLFKYVILFSYGLYGLASEELHNKLSQFPPSFHHNHIFNKSLHK